MAAWCLCIVSCIVNLSFLCLFPFKQKVLCYISLVMMLCIFVPKFYINIVSLFQHKGFHFDKLITSIRKLKTWKLLFMRGYHIRDMSLSINLVFNLCKNWLYIITFACSPSLYVFRMYCVLLVRSYVII